MKKIIFSSIVVFVIFICLNLLAGCRKKAEAQLDYRGIVVGFSQAGTETDWRMAHTESIKTTFTEENGYKLIFNDARQKQENQIEAIRNFIRQDVDYLIISPVVKTGWETILVEAVNARIPVILCGSMIDPIDLTLFTAWVGGNFIKEGKDSVHWLNEYLRKTGRDNDEIRIVHIQGILESSVQLGRTRGISEELAQKANYKLLASQTGEFSQEKGREVMESFLEIYGDIDVVFAENDYMAFGAIDAIKASGKIPGREILIISFDAVKEAFFKMINGEMNCSVESNPLHGPRVSEIIQILEAGGSVDKIIYVTEETFDMFNAEAKMPTRQY